MRVIFQLTVLHFLILAWPGYTHAQTITQSKVRGIDFRMQINRGTLNFTTVSGVERSMDGFGSELASHIYLIERGRFRSTFQIASRVMSYTSTGLQLGETDDLQVFTVAPGFELCYGPFFVQTAYQMMNINNYWVSTTSIGSSYAFTTSSLSGGFNWRFGHLGLGFGMTTVNAAVDQSKLGISVPSQWKETSYSINLIYYIGTPPSKFFPGLFKNR